MKTTFYIKSILISLLLISSCLTVSCKSDESCEYTTIDPCGGSATKPLVDLIVLIDTSGSMSSSAAVISAEATAAIDDALMECDTDLRVVYLGVDGTFSGTNFTTSHRNYIYGVAGSSVVLAGDLPHLGFNQEQGANAVEDLSKYFDWRENACRAIFYISDEELDSISPRGDFSNEDLVTANAIAEAQRENVAVFANFLTYQNLGSSILTNYTDLTSQTGGLLFTVPTITAGYYTGNTVFNQIVCNSCNGCD